MPEMNPARIGGSFAPPLDDARLEAYRELAEKASPQVAEAMNALLAMADAYNERPESEEEPAGTPHPSGRGTITPLAEGEVERLWDVVPWEDELAMYGQVFDRIDAGTDKATRDAAFHLLWYGRELNLDRIPMTTDRL